MKISIVVPSYRRPAQLQRCLAALDEQERSPDEVIVVHRADDEPTAAVVAENRSAWTRGAVVKRVGVLAAMEAGVEAASGDVVAFTDDDAVPRSDWLRRIEAALEADEQVVGVGGRDWCWYGSRLVEEGRRQRVGRVQWFGRLTSGHHAGTDAPQDVHVLKGCNMAFRMEALADIGFDHRLRGQGAQTHYELSLCLQALRRGGSLRYDPAVAVDHFPAPRHDRDQRDQPAYEAIVDSVHNETLAVLEHFGIGRRVAYAAWATLIGTTSSPGLLQALRLRVSGDESAGQVLRAVLRGRRAGARTFLASHRLVRPDFGLAVVSHAPSGMDRGQQLFDGRAARIVAGGRSLAGTGRALAAVIAPNVKAVYLIDVGTSTTLAALVGRVLGRRVVVDTGDVGFELARSVGRRGRFGLGIVWLGERLTLAAAHQIVVRGSAHVPLLGGKGATVIRDLPPVGARPRDGSCLRRDLGWEDNFVVGLVGTLNHAPRLGIGYGWDLVEALAQSHPAVVGLIVGDGAGRQILEDRARQLGVSDRLRFLGRLDPAATIDAIGAMDMAISTQSNDVVGAVRTTGKLPLYLASGCPVLASHVGEAATLLGPLGWTLPYDGTVDRSYPRRLAAAIGRWLEDPDGQADRRHVARQLAMEAFDLGRARASALAVVRSRSYA